MGDHILVSVDGKKLCQPSEVMSNTTVGSFVHQHNGGVFVYEGQLVSKEQFDRFREGIELTLKRLERDYGKTYGWSAKTDEAVTSKKSKSKSR